MSTEKLSETIKRMRSRPGKRDHDTEELRAPYDPMTEDEAKEAFSTVLHCITFYSIRRHHRTLCNRPYSNGSSYGVRIFRKMIALNMNTCPECRAAIISGRTSIAA